MFWRARLVITAWFAGAFAVVLGVVAASSYFTLVDRLDAHGVDLGESLEDLLPRGGGDARAWRSCGRSSSGAAGASPPPRPDGEPA